MIYKLNHIRNCISNKVIGSSVLKISIVLIAVQRIGQTGAQRSSFLLILDDLGDSCTLERENECTAFSVEQYILFVATWNAARWLCD